MDMNYIECSWDRSDYEGYDSFPNYKIDGYWLDETLDVLYPSQMYKGLIPTLVHWIAAEKEKEVVWHRILPEDNSTTYCPVLMCPDDNDFSCTLIIAEIKNCGSTIAWTRLGIDETAVQAPERVGSTIKWLDKVTAFRFSREAYLKMLDLFRRELIANQPNY